MAFVTLLSGVVVVGLVPSSFCSAVFATIFWGVRVLCNFSALEDANFVGKLSLRGGVGAGEGR